MSEKGSVGVSEKMATIDETVRIGQRFADKVVDFFGIREVTGGHPIEVGKKGVESYLLRRIKDPSRINPYSYDIESDIKGLRSAVELVNSGNGEVEVHAPHLLGEIRTVMSDMSVNGQRLLGWESTGKGEGHFVSSTTGSKIAQKIETNPNLRVNKENQKGISDLLDSCQEFTVSINKLREVDNQTGNTIQKENPTWEGIYGPVNSK